MAAMKKFFLTHKKIAQIILLVTFILIIWFNIRTILFFQNQF